jgi:ABC-type Mn2+/Zn2+ transport system permease subunit
VAVAAAVHEVGALLTFALLTLPAMAALFVARSIRVTFAVSTLLGLLVPVVGLVVAFQLDLPVGPATVALLVLGVPIAATLGRRLEAGRLPPAA